MPLPGEVVTTTITGQILQSDSSGTPAQGNIVFHQRNVLRDSSGNVVLVPAKYVVTLDPTGSFSVVVPVTDASGISPSGFTYLIEVNTTAWKQTFEALIPTGLTKFADIAPVEDSPRVVLYSLFGHTHTGSGSGDGGFRGNWSSSVSYLPGDAVLHAASGLFYGALLANTNVTPGSNPSTWAVVTYTKAQADTLLATKANASHVHSGADITSGTVAYARLPVGTVANTITAGDDARLSDARTPTAHASSHASAGSDPIIIAQSQVTGLTAALGALQPLDADLTAIAALTPADDDIIQRKSSAWTNRTMAQLATDVQGSLVIAESQVTGLTTDLAGKVPTSRAVNTTAPLSGGGDLTADRTLTLLDDGVTNAKLANMPSNTIKGNNTGGSTDPIDLTTSQVKTLLAIGISDVSGLQTSLDGKTDKATLTTKGDLYVATASATVTRQGVGSDGQVLTADSAQTNGVKWATPSGGADGAFRGTWSSGTSFIVGDTTTYVGFLVASKTAHTNQPPYVETSLPSISSPGTVDSGDGAGYNIGLQFSVSKPILTKLVRFYKAAANTGVHTMTLFAQSPTSPMGFSGWTICMQKEFTGESASGLQTIPFEWLLIPGINYRLAIVMSAGHYSVTTGVFSSPVTVGSVTFPANAGVFIANTTPNTLPTSTSTSWYHVDFTWQELDTTNWTELSRVNAGIAADQFDASLAAQRWVGELYAQPNGLAATDANGWVINSLMPGKVALTDAATIATNASSGGLFRVTLGGNRTLGNPTGATDGQQLLWELIQDGTGNRTLTLDTKFALGTDIAAVVLTTSANKRDFLEAVYNASTDKFYVTRFVKGY